MKNVILLLIDSVYSECLGDNRTEVSSTPFIDEIASQGLYSTHVYSYGPYTDAATRGLYCGNRTLDDYGYYFGINTPAENHFKTFYENGYETYGLYYPYYLIGPNVKKYINHSIYTGGFEYKSEWGGKFNYYADLKKTRELTDSEYKLLIKHVDLMFDCWLSFYEDIEKDSDSSLIVKDYKMNSQEYIGKKKLVEEYSFYIKNKKTYVDQILMQGMEHVLATINDYTIDSKINKAFINNIYKHNPKFFGSIKRNQKSRNIKNNKFDWKQAKNSKRYIINYLLNLFQQEYMEHLSKKNGWQYSASAFTQIDTILKLIDKRVNNNRPFYMSLHVEDPHNYISYFTYDIESKEQIADELGYLKPLVDNCGKKFKGNLSYQLSLRYIDYCVKHLFDGLKVRKLLDNTMVVLTADHGSSYTNFPLRSSVVNNFYNENYQTPLIIWTPDCNNPIKTDALFSAEDTLKTLLKEAKLKVPDKYKGIDMRNNTSGRDYIITEYMGPGVPDMINRDVWMSARNNKYVVSYICNISGNFKKDNPIAVFDLVNDINELNPLKIGVDIPFEDISELVYALENRFNEIKNKTSDYLSRLDF